MDQNQSKQSLPTQSQYRELMQTQHLLKTIQEVNLDYFRRNAYPTYDPPQTTLAQEELKQVDQALRAHMNGLPVTLKISPTQEVLLDLPELPKEVLVYRERLLQEVSQNLVFPPKDQRLPFRNMPGSAPQSHEQDQDQQQT